MRIFGLVLIYLAFLGIIGPLLLIFNLQTTVLGSTEPLKNALAKADTYNRVSSLTSEELSKFLEDDSRDPNSQISPEQIQQILASIPPETIRRVAEQGLDAYFQSLKNGQSSFGIDIQEVKQKTFGGLPPELLAEVNKSVPDTYNVKINPKNTGIIRWFFNPLAKYYCLAALLFLALISLLLGKGWRGKLRSLAGLLLITGIIATVSYFALKMFPLSKLMSLTDNAASQKILSLINDVLNQMLSPVIVIYRAEWVYTFSATFVLFLLTWIIPNRRPAVASTTAATVAVPPAPAPAVPATPAPAPVNPVETIAAKSDKPSK